MIYPASATIAYPIGTGTGIPFDELTGDLAIQIRRAAAAVDLRFIICKNRTIYLSHNCWHHICPRHFDE
jgi:hypothetical protein